MNNVLEVTFFYTHNSGLDWAENISMDSLTENTVKEMSLVFSWLGEDITGVYERISDIIKKGDVESLNHLVVLMIKKTGITWVRGDKYFEKYYKLNLRETREGKDGGILLDDGELVYLENEREFFLLHGVNPKHNNGVRLEYDSFGEACNMYSEFKEMGYKGLFIEVCEVHGTVFDENK